MKKQNYFSLIEIMVVIAIIGILVSYSSQLCKELAKLLEMHHAKTK